MFPQSPVQQRDALVGGTTDISTRYANWCKVEFPPTVSYPDRLRLLDQHWHHTAHVWHRLQERNFSVGRNNSAVYTSITHGSALYRIWASHAEGHVIEPPSDDDDHKRPQPSAKESEMTASDIQERDQREERMYFEWAGPTVVLYDAHDVITDSEFHLITDWWKYKATWTEQRQLLATAEREFMRAAVARRFFRERCQHARSVVMLEKTYNADIASIVGEFLTQGISPRHPPRTLWAMVDMHRQRLRSGAACMEPTVSAPIHIVTRLQHLGMDGSSSSSGAEGGFHMDDIDNDASSLAFHPGGRHARVSSPNQWRRRRQPPFPK
jgi:hypothetical protein